MHVFTMKDIDRHGIAIVMKRALARAGKGTTGIHVSFDLDVCDPAIAPGVGTPVKGGLDYREALAMEMVADSRTAAGPGPRRDQSSSTPAIRPRSSAPSWCCRRRSRSSNRWRRKGRDWRQPGHACRFRAHRSSGPERRLMGRQERQHMSQVIAFTNVTLDGVMQAPGRPDEDTRGGFTQGGWAAPYRDAARRRRRHGRNRSPLRAADVDFHDVWPKRKDSPFSAMLDHAEIRRVADLQDRSRMNSTLLHGGRRTPSRSSGRARSDLLVMGSGDIVQSLRRGTSSTCKSCSSTRSCWGRPTAVPDGGAFSSWR